MGLCYDIACFMFWPHGVWHLSSPTRMEPTSLALEGKVLTLHCQGEAPFWMCGFDQ